jgi:BCD family chlorophyll transporter-like MFS transporter
VSSPSATAGLFPSDTVAPPLRWVGIVRLGLVQAALGSVVVLVTSTLNRVMVVEYSLPAMLPGLLVALHYAVQLIRPRFGHGSDQGGRRTPWIVGGMAVLAAGGVLCAAATVLMGAHFGVAVALAVLGYASVGFGVGAAGTSLLVLMAARVDDRRRAAAATIMWILMIAGFAVTSTAVGHFLDPFSPQRLLRVTGIAAAAAFLLAVAALWKVEKGGGAAPGRRAASPETPTQGAASPGTPTQGAASRGALNRDGSFSVALKRVWAEPQARRFTLFVFVSMLAYSAEELLLEPFCGLVFGCSIGDSARLSGLWHAAAFAGMVGVGLAAGAGRRFGSLRAWTIGGCCASGAAIASLAFAGAFGPGWPLRVSVMALGVSNGVFAVAAIGSMMELAQRGEARNAGVRMGLWGAAQAIAFAMGGVLGTSVVDGVRWLGGSPGTAFAAVFALEAALFLAAAGLATRVDPTRSRISEINLPVEIV